MKGRMKGGEEREERKGRRGKGRREKGRRIGRQRG